MMLLYLKIFLLKTDDVTLFKDISSKDGVDTMNAARKYVTEPSMKFFNHVMDCIKRA